MPNFCARCPRIRPSACYEEQMPTAISVRAFNFATFGRPVRGARIFAVGERAVTLAVTDAQGCAVVHRPPGQELSLVIEKEGFVSTQSTALVVPEKTLCGHHQEVTFQILPTWFFAAAKRWLRVPSVPGLRHLVTTVTAQGMTLRDAVQGEPSATIQVTRNGSALDTTPIYLGIIPFVHKTDLFSARWRRGAATSADGGVLIPNLQVGSYTIKAEAPGRSFSLARAVLCDDSPELINLSPPWGPQVLSIG